MKEGRKDVDRVRGKITKEIRERGNWYTKEGEMKKKWKERGTARRK